LAGKLVGLTARMEDQHAINARRIDELSAQLEEEQKRRTDEEEGEDDVEHLRAEFADMKRKQQNALDAAHERIDGLQEDKQREAQGATAAAAKANQQMEQLKASISELYAASKQQQENKQRQEEVARTAKIALDELRAELAKAEKKQTDVSAAANQQMAELAEKQREADAAAAAAAVTVQQTLKQQADALTAANKRITEIQKAQQAAAAAAADQREKQTAELRALKSELAAFKATMGNRMDGPQAQPEPSPADAAAASPPKAQQQQQHISDRDAQLKGLSQPQLLFYNKRGNLVG
jgi:colicin import membrane protein